jgi:hypothetical protein
MRRCQQTIHTPIDISSKHAAPTITIGTNSTSVAMSAIAIGTAIVVSATIVVVVAALLDKSSVRNETLDDGKDKVGVLAESLFIVGIGVIVVVVVVGGGGVLNVVDVANCALVFVSVLVPGG